MVATGRNARSMVSLTLIALFLAVTQNTIRSADLSMETSPTPSNMPIEQQGQSIAPITAEETRAQAPQIQTLRFEANADSYVSNTPSTRDANYGTLTSFDVDSSPESEGLIRFVVHGGRGAVAKATLRLYVRDGSNTPPLISGAANNWNESTVTWDTRPPRIGHDVVSSRQSTSGSVAEFDVTPLIGANGTFTLNLIARSSDRIRFTSRESRATSQRPTLVVQFDTSAPTATASPSPSVTPSSTATVLPTATATPAVHSLEFDVEADTYIANTVSSANRNFGSMTNIAVDRDPELDGLLRFSVAGVEGGVTRATLRLYCRDGSDAAPVVAAGRASWDEATVTWDTQPGHGEPVAGVSSSIEKDSFVDLDVTTLVGGNGTFTFQLIAQSPDGASFTSRESSAEAQRPRLVVEFSPSAPTATASPTPPPTPAPTPDASETKGNRDYGYGRGTFAPTAKEGQSKVWYADGVWWGALFYPATGDYFISALDQDTHAWIRTTTKIDARNNAKIDTLWDEETGKLYTVATMARSNAEIVVRRFSYANGKYTRDEDFTREPIAIAGAVDGVVTIAKDTRGVLWVSFVPFGGDKLVYVTHSTQSPEANWVKPYVISDPGAPLRDEEIAVDVAFGGQVGVMWSDQNTGTIHFARHVDGTADSDWVREIAFSAPRGADNHISLKSDSDGRVYAAVKTSFHLPNEPLLMLLIRYPDGTWTSAPFSTVSDNQTRPMVVVDESTGTLVFFAADSQLNRGKSGGRIYCKQVPLDDIVFAPGKGDVVISGDENPALNNVSSTKQLITEGMGILVIAGDDQTRTYWHAVLP